MDKELRKFGTIEIRASIRRSEAEGNTSLKDAAAEIDMLVEPPGDMTKCCGWKGWEGG